jgi:LuxR family transcriptional activator of conjugal transfer of Ti plasmids
MSLSRSLPRARQPQTAQPAERTFSAPGSRTTPLQPALHDLARGLGFHSGIYVHLGHAFRQPGFVTPARFVASSPFDTRLHLDEGALAYDPVKLQAVDAHAPFAWSTEATSHLTEQQQQLYARLRGRGIHAGVAVPVQDYAAGPAYLSLYSAFADEAERLVRDQGPALAFAAATFHARAKTVIVAFNHGAGEASLTTREVECLRLAALGHTSGECAAALQVSIRTVEFHLANVCEKLGAPNRIRAVALAVAWGLVEP